MIAITPRSRELARRILTATKPLVIQDLADGLNVSPRTIRYDLGLLKDWFEERKAVLIAKPRLGVWVECSDETKARLVRETGCFGPSRRVFNTTERMLFGLLVLIKSDAPVSMTHLAEAVGVSRSTMASTMADAKAYVKDSGLSIVGRPRLGYVVQGGERQRRALIAKVIGELISENDLLGLFALSLHDGSIKQHLGLAMYESGYMGEETVQNIVRIGRLVRLVLGPTLPDVSFLALVVHLAIAVERISQGWRIHLDKENLATLQRTQAYIQGLRLSREICRAFDVDIPPEEVGYITLHLLGCRNTQPPLSSPMGDEELSRNVDLFLSAVEKELGLQLRGNRALRNGLFLHLRQYLSRSRHGMREENPLREQVKSQYSQLFSRVLQSLEDVFGTAHKDEDEAAYLCMHICAAMEREKQPKVYRAIVACSTGAGSSSLLAARLAREFPHIEIVAVTSALNVLVEAVRTGAHLIISTVSLPHNGVPVVVVSPLLTMEDIHRLHQCLNGMILQRGAEHSLAHLEGWAEDLAYLVSHCSTMEHRRTVIREFLGKKLPAWTQISKEAEEPQVSAEMMQFVTGITSALQISVNPRVILGLAIHLAFALSRWKTAQFVVEDKAELKKWLRTHERDAGIVLQHLKVLAQSYGTPPPPIGEAIAILRYFHQECVDSTSCAVHAQADDK